MTFKSILFCLFLYVCLVWVGAGYLYSGPKVAQVGLLWTGAGLLVVLLLTLFSRLFSWARLLWAKLSAIPKRVSKPSVPVFEDEAQLRVLLDEANLTLARVYRTGFQQTPKLSSFPVYLLIGPEASGKTSTFLSAGLEPQLLAGDAGSRGPLTATRLCNIWLAQEKIFIELAGQLFSGDLIRWQRLLRALESKPERSRWQRIWCEVLGGLDLRGAIAFCDVKEFVAGASPQAQERLSKQFQDWHERLGVLSEVFGLECPVTFLITKCDALPYFSDFFRRLSESDVGQVLGCGFPLIGNKDIGSAPSAEVESKRLTKSFNSLFRSLAEKRVAHLAHEPELARRPAIYEFPRELKRIRPALVQFLTSVFRPHALRPSPRLRGYYLTAVCEREAAPSLGNSQSHSQWSEVSASLEATTLFRSDATRVLRGGGSGGDLSLLTKPTVGTTRNWLFVSELFQSFLTAQEPLRAKQQNSAIENQWRTACFAVCTVCLILCCIFVASWAQNLRLLNSVHNSTAARRTAGPPTVAELEGLEDLRVQITRLTTYYRDGPPLSLRWGLYSGSGILEPMRAEYFRRFQQLLLQPLNTAMTDKLAVLPTTPGPNAPYGPAFRALKAHLMISSGDCKPEPVFVFGVLKEIRDQAMPSRDLAWQTLADRQIRFYADELSVRNPCRLMPDVAVRDHARQYLANIQGVDRLYGGMLSAAQKAFPQSQKLSELAPNYAQVLSGPNEIAGVFSSDGWTYIEKASHSGSVTSSESCVLGGNLSVGGEWKPKPDNARAIQRLFVRDYVESWRKYLSAFSVLRYSGPSDAARKLDILSDHKSPLLALLAMTSNQTNFAAVKPEAEGLEKVKPMVSRFFPSLGAKSRAIDVVSKRRSDSQELLTNPADISKAFQPVHSVVPPGGDTWVVDKNAAYIDALAVLGHSMRDLGKAAGIPDPAVLQAVTQSYDKALDAARQIARGFEPMGVGVDVIVARLLEAPIRQTQPLIPNNLDNLTAELVNGQLHRACDHIRPTLRKYPFQTSEIDATLDEVSAAFAPAVGAIWKFQTQYLADWTVKEGNRWKEKDPGKKPQVTPEILNFLNRAQTLSDVFYPSGSSQPRLTYTLRPKLDPSFKDAILEFDVDGQPNIWNSSLQKQFVWPAPAGSRNIEVKGIIKMGSVSFPFTSRGGTWAMFRVMSDAEPRTLTSRIVEWKHIRGGGGRMEEIQPAPVRLEFVEFPGGVDLFNPKFFSDLQCPMKALQ